MAKLLASVVSELPSFDVLFLCLSETISRSSTEYTDEPCLSAYLPTHALYSSPSAIDLRLGQCWLGNYLPHGSCSDEQYDEHEPVKLCACSNYGWYA